MAKIKPFKGVRYNPNCFEQLDVVVSQPYDRISADLEAQYLGLCPYNITGIILGHDEDEHFPGSGNSGNGYSRAKHNYEQWLAEGILIRDDQPAVYAYEQTFTVADTTYTRLGMITALELTEFDEGTVLPHERTHSGPKADRLNLLTTLEVNPEQIFMLYPDTQNRVNALLRQAIGNRNPDIDVVETFENQVQQRLWIITDLTIIQAIQTVMAPLRSLIIADGHHRYETALNYRRQIIEENPELIDDERFADAALNYVPVTLVSMDDPGLVVLPTHREIRNFTDTTPQEVLDRAADYFDIEPAVDLETTINAVDANPDGHSFGFYGEKTGFKVLTLKPEVDIDATIVVDRSTAWKSLSVSIAHRLLLEQLAEVPFRGMEDKTMIRYHRNLQDPVDNINSGHGNFVVFLRGTTMHQIKEVAGYNEKMPQKSTDFYPKVISGLTMMPIGRTEFLRDSAITQALQKRFSPLPAK